jgi:hypothetical protein
MNVNDPAQDCRNFPYRDSKAHFTDAAQCDEYTGWETSLQAVVIDKFTKYNSRYETTGIDVDAIRAIYPPGSAVPSDTAMQAQMYQKLALSVALACWVNQLYDESTNAANYQKRADGTHESPAVMQRFTLGLVVSPPDGNGNRQGRIVIKLHGSAHSQCGQGANGTTSMNPSMSLLGVELNAWDVNDPSLAKVREAGMTGDLIFENANDVKCGVGCSGSYAPLIVPMTGQTECCARVSWQNAMATAYAFALLWTTIVGLAISPMIALIWGKQFVDMDELKAGLKENPEGVDAVKSTALTKSSALKAKFNK